MTRSVSRSLCSFLLLPILAWSGPDELAWQETKPLNQEASPGIIRHYLKSPFLHQTSPVDILLPEAYTTNGSYKVLYVLPVEEGLGQKWGNSLREVKKLNAHNQYQWICVAPTFDTLPWYGAHANDPGKRHEDYLKKALIPFIEMTYAARQDAEGRLLLGFSKSGWGALSLLFRNPDFFGYAASWDAPLLMDRSKLGLFGTQGHFGTADQFEKYLPTIWARNSRDRFTEKKRIALLGHKGFGTHGSPTGEPHTKGFHTLLQRLEVPHVYNNRLVVKHHWESGWVGPALAALAAMSHSGEKAGSE